MFSCVEIFAFSKLNNLIFYVKSINDEKTFIACLFIWVTNLRLGGKYMSVDIGCHKKIGKKKPAFHLHRCICDVSRSINRWWTSQSLEQSSSRIGSIYKQCTRTFRSLVCDYLEFNLSKWECDESWMEHKLFHGGMRVVYVYLYSCKRVFEFDLRTDLRISLKFFFNLLEMYVK